MPLHAPETRANRSCRVFLYEFITGGGCYSLGSTPAGSLLAEGRAMIEALASDFSALPNVSVDMLHDVRVPALNVGPCTIHNVASANEEQAAFDRLASQADWTMVIAPEFDWQLLRRCTAVEHVGGRLLGPALATVALASDKHVTCEHLHRYEVPVLRGRAVDAGEELPILSYPAVLKPRDGAGSQGVELLTQWQPGRTAIWPACLQKFWPGTPASVAVLCGPNLAVPLVPCLQRLVGGEGTDAFRYLGGSLPIAPDLAERAIRLARAAVARLIPGCGYLGIDMVLGADRSGSKDLVIEINPRLTTSYTGLRALAEGNLAAAMLEIAEGREVALCWKPGPIQFDA